MICNFMIFLEYVGSRASLSANRNELLWLRRRFAQEYETAVFYLLVELGTMSSPTKSHSVFCNTSGGAVPSQSCS